MTRHQGQPGRLLGFLADDNEIKRDFSGAGFDILSFENQTDASLLSQTTFRKKVEAEGLPPLGVHVLFGPEFLQLQLDTLRAPEDGRIRPVQIVARKPG